MASKVTEQCPQCKAAMEPRPVRQWGRDNHRFFSGTDSLQLWQCPACHYVLLSDRVRYE